MKFLEARKLVDGFTGGPDLDLELKLSGSYEPFELYLRAGAARLGRNLRFSALPFGTLAQALRTEPANPRAEVLLLVPWDLVPEADWRTGVPGSADFGAFGRAAAETAALVARRVRAGARALYVPASIPPIMSSPAQSAALARQLESLALEAGASVLSPAAFSLAGYLANGCPLGGAAIGDVAVQIVDAVVTKVPEPKKLLVTDLDNVVWAGGIAEDGLDGVAFKAHGTGYRHFVYQTMLKRLRADGAILAAVSRNDADVVIAPFRNGHMTLGEEDFVSVLASYHAKSAQIRELVTRLNLGLNSVVFVDDNPIELAEVSLALPEVQCIAFPPRDDAFAPFLDSIAAAFARTEVTAEDRERTERYRRMLDGIAPSDVGGADLQRFLESLGMSLTIQDRSRGDRTRVVQLINKTNQFNQNGGRVTDEEVARILAEGGKLYGASLEDRSGSHGEILACLIGGDHRIVSFVMSCRVFQRRVEHAFLAWLMRQADPPVGLTWSRTPRNEPFATFLEQVLGATPPEGSVELPREQVQGACASALPLFTLTAQ